MKTKLNGSSYVPVNFVSSNLRVTHPALLNSAFCEHWLMQQSITVNVIHFRLVG